VLGIPSSVNSEMVLRGSNDRAQARAISSSASALAGKQTPRRIRAIQF